MDQAVTPLVVEYLDRIAEGNDPREVAEELCSREPDSADALRRALRALDRTGLETTARHPGRDHPSRLGEFELERRIGGGGMGVVYLARQAGVARPVALKVVRSDHLYLDGARQRFRREIEIVGRLAHPNIASVYAVDERGGVPFCAMEYVPGASLSESLRRLVGSRVETLTGLDLRAAVSAARQDVDPSTVVDPDLFEGTWTATCLRVVREVARALEHAHEREVLHRDVKPSNVMLTTGGRVVLLDFGLARLREGGDLTQTGAAMGSMPYMAPEQAAGRSREIDERTDVYGLGVLLYELLTLRPPFVGRNLEHTRGLILDGGALPVRALNTGVPRDVEIIVARAMDVERTRRYPSMPAFMRDLVNVLERRPIEARPASLFVRVDRLVRRRPAATLALLASALLLLGGPLAYAWIQRTHAREMSSALSDTEAHLESALQAIAEVLRPLSDRDLVDSPGLQDLRVTTYQRGLELIETIEQRRSGDPRVRHQRALLELGLGAARVEQGQVSTGMEVLARAVDALDQLASDDERASELERIFERIRAHRELGLAQLQYGDQSAGEASLMAALALCEQSVDDHPADLELLLAHSNVLSNIGSARAESSRDEAGRHSMRDAEQLAQRAVALHPQSAAAKARLGETRAQQAMSLQLNASVDWIDPQALGLLELAADSLGEAVMLEPETRAWSVQLAAVLHELARAQFANGNVEDCEFTLDWALELLDELCSNFPEVWDYKWRRLNVLETRSLIQFKRGDRERAADAGAQIADTYLELIGRSTAAGAENLAAVAALGNAASHLINLYSRGFERFVLAKRWTVAARDVLTRWPGDTYAEQRASFEVFIACLLARIQAETGEMEEAIATLRACEQVDTGRNARNAGQRGECWAQLWSLLPEDDVQRETCRTGVLNWTVRAFEYGLPADVTLKGDYFLPFAEEPALVEAARRQLGDI